MPASPDAFTDILPLRMQEEAYKAAKVAATKVVDDLSMKELLHAKKKKGISKAPADAGSGPQPQQPGLVPKKPGMQVVCEDVEMVQSEVDTSVCPKMPGHSPVVDDETASTRAVG